MYFVWITSFTDWLLLKLKHTTSFPILQFGLRSLNQLQASWQLYLIELLKLSIGLGSLNLWHFIYPCFSLVCTHASLLHKLKSYEISGQIFGLILSFHNEKRHMDLVNAGVPQGSILGPTLFLLYINDLPDEAICNIAIYADNTTLYTKCDHASRFS